MKTKILITTLGATVGITTAFAGGIYCSDGVKQGIKEGYTCIAQNFSEAKYYVEQINPLNEKKVDVESKLEQKAGEKGKELPKQITSTGQESSEEKKDLKKNNLKSPEEMYNSIKELVQREYNKQKNYVLRKLSQPLYEKVAEEFDQYLAQKLDNERIVNRVYTKIDESVDDFSKEQLLHLERMVRESLERKLTVEERAKNNYGLLLQCLPEFSQEALLGLHHEIINKFSEQSYEHMLRQKSAQFWTSTLNKAYKAKLCTEEY
ncbi:hypothetical protein HYX11_02965 [Candidatus Woesearchaeota archaeon]|nr:hypothetical protein [Candidatus Woesearchaeota archaeon]